MQTPPVGHRVHPADLHLPPTVRVHVEPTVVAAVRTAPTIGRRPAAGL